MAKGHICVLTLRGCTQATFEIYRSRSLRTLDTSGGRSKKRGGDKIQRMHDLHMCEHEYSHAQLMWLTRVRVLSELEVIVKDAELALRDAKIAMLQRRLRVVKKQRRGRKLGKFSI
jgi:hypothetical protein